MRLVKSVQEISDAHEGNLGSQYAFAFGALKASLELFYEYDLDDAESLEDLKRRFREMFDKYMEEK